jgi:hypothetical protein
MKLKLVGLAGSIFFLLSFWGAEGECIKDEPIGNSKLERFFSFSDSVFNDALKQLLEASVKSAVKSASSGAFYRDINIHISPPGKFVNLKEISGITGYSLEIKRLESSLNRSAAQASEDVLPIFLEEIKKVKFRNPDEVVVSGDSSATSCLKKEAKEKLVRLAKPYVRNELEESGAVETCESIKSNPFLSRFVKGEGCDFVDYVSEKLVEGIFTLMEREERDIRHNPKRWDTQTLKDVIGTAHYFDF